MAWLGFRFLQVARFTEKEKATLKKDFPIQLVSHPTGVLAL